VGQEKNEKPAASAATRTRTLIKRNEQHGIGRRQLVPAPMNNKTALDEVKDIRIWTALIGYRLQAADHTRFLYEGLSGQKMPPPRSPGRRHFPAVFAPHHA
jgi:hypothetical protein